MFLLIGLASAMPDAAALSDAGRVDEGVALLAAQLPDSTAALTAALLSHPPRLAWVSLAEALSAHTDAPSVAAWHAAARMRDPAQRVQGRAELARLAARWPDDIVVRNLTAEGMLMVGQISQASMLAPDVVGASCRSLDMARACAAERAHDPAVAEAILESALSRVSRAEKARILTDLARLERRLGRDGEAATHLQAALAIRPEDAAIIAPLIDARLAISQVDAARALLTDASGEAARRVEAVGRLIGTDPAVDTAAVTAAFSLAPDHPRVIAAEAHRLLAGEAGEEAMALLAPALSRHGVQEPLLSLYTWGAVITGQPERAEAVLRRGLQSARDPEGWSARLEELSRYMMIAAEADKAAGRSAEAIDRYQLASALTSDSASGLVGLAGALWASGDLRGAERAYARAAQLRPEDPGILIDRVRLLQSRDALEEARMLLIASGQTAPQLQALELELEIGARARPARRASAEGRHEEAVERYRALELEYPGSPLLLHELADVLLVLGRHEAAAVTYARAQRQAPDDLWLRLGEASAWLAAGELTNARQIIDDIEPAGDLQVADALQATGLSLRRGEASAAMAAGRHAEALSIYAALYAEQPSDPWTLLGIAGLYGRDQQHGLAYAFYQAAWLQEPTDPTLQEGRITAFLSMGELAEARLAAAALLQSHPSDRHFLLVQAVARRQFLRRVDEAAALGRMALAEEQLRARLNGHPGDTAVRARYAALLLEQGAAAAALNEALTVLRAVPDSPEALGVLRSAGAMLSRAELVRDRFAAAGADWTQAELPLLELAVITEAAAKLAAAGRHREAVAQLEEAQRRHGNAEPRCWVILGAGWLQLAEPIRAQGAFETALSLAPGDPDAIAGLSGALQSQGRTRDAVRMASAQWQATADPQIGTELVRLYRVLGRRAEAEALEATLARTPAVRAPRTSLVRLALPSGQSIPEPVEPIEPVESVEPEVAPLVGWDLGAGMIQRPGEPGLQQLTVQLGTLAAELRTGSRLRLGAEITPLQINDGLTTVTGTAVSGRVGIRAGDLSAAVRLGSTPLGLIDPPRLMWDGALTTSIAGDFTATLSTTRAPVTDSATSWLSGVTDTWSGGQLIYAPSAELGILGRIGESTGGGIETLPWNQAMVWGIWPVQERDRFTLSAWTEGMVLLHDRQIDGFDVGQAGVFSPRGYYAAAGRLLGEWRSQDDQLGLCGVAGLGPQHIIGAETLYLGPGTWMGYSLEAQLSLRVTETLTARGGYHISGTWGRWYQSLALLQVGTGAASPSPTVSSMVHGPPLVEPRACLGADP
ncbi:MAG: tetratricopeptide repeat protein [Myxococcota bacterium]|nr:tetratricopeptide repeat protein [Myxococcota bacterium]